MAADLSRRLRAGTLLLGCLWTAAMTVLLLWTSDPVSRRARGAAPDLLPAPPAATTADGPDLWSPRSFGFSALWLAGLLALGGGFSVARRWIHARAAAERALAESQRRLQLFFNQSLDGYYFSMLDVPQPWHTGTDKEAVLDYVETQQRITEVNDALATQYHTTRDGLVGRPLHHFLQHDPELARRFRRQLFDEGRLHVDTRELRDDGTPIWIEGDYVCIYDEHHRITGTFGMQRDITQRKRALQDLAGREALLRAVLDSIRDAILVIGERGEVRLANRRFQEIWNIPDALLASHEDAALLDHVHSQLVDPEAFRTEVQRLYQTDEQERTLIRFKDGRTIERFSRPVVLSGVRCRLWSFRDITQQRQAEDALRHSEAKWRSYLENAPVGVVVADTEGHHVEANRPAEAMLGYEPGGLLRLQVSDLPCEEDAEAARRHFEEVRLHGLADGQFRLRRKDGRQLWVSVRATRIPGGRILGVFQDISDRKRAEEALLNSLRTAADIVQTIPSGLFIYQFVPPASLLLLQSNPEAERLTGISATQYQGREFNELWPGAQAAGLTHRFLDVLRSGVPVDSRDFPYRDSRIAGAFHIRAFRLPGDRLAVAFEDTTEAKRAADELRASRRQLRALASALTRAEHRERRRIAALLHDDVIQSLALTQIQLGALRASITSRDQQAALDSIRAHLDRAIGNTRSMTFQLSPPILHELGLEAALGWLADRMTEQHGLRCTCAPGAGNLPLDDELRNLLFSATRELLLNVVKHAHASQAQITTQLHETAFRIVVEDNGDGFDPTALTQTPDGSGGFGLFSIRERLHHLDGHCDVDSAPGHGTRVTLTVPIPKVPTTNSQ